MRPLVATLEVPAPATAKSAPEHSNEASRARWYSGLAIVLREPALRRLSFASFSFAFTQLCFTTFLVSYLKLELGQSLATAAAVLAGSQAISTASRIAWGHAADRWIRPSVLLASLGIAMGLACAVLGLLDYTGHAGVSDAAGTGASLAWVIAAAVFCAATIMGWNGVFFAELARQAGRHDMATLAGASQFITFAGSMGGPVIFAEVIRLGGSYGGAYLALAGLPLLSGMVLLRSELGRAARQ
jgi:nitrate/nitrite transporter NarK